MKMSLNYRLARAGRIPAECLETWERHALVGELIRHGMTHDEIAAHTRMTAYTTSRIHDMLDSATDRRAARTGVA